MKYILQERGQFEIAGAGLQALSEFSDPSTDCLVIVEAVDDVNKGCKIIIEKVVLFLRCGSVHGV